MMVMASAHLTPTSKVEGPSPTDLTSRCITLNRADRCGSDLTIFFPAGVSRDRIKAIADLINDALDEARAGERAQAAE